MAESPLLSDHVLDKSSRGRVIRKRKHPDPAVSVKEEDSDDEQGPTISDKKPRHDDPESSREKFARENHSEIERRRRNKMNSYINELSEMVPSCNENPKKPDKLTVLRMAVDHIKNLREPLFEQSANTKSASFLSDRELKVLVLEAAGGFLFVVNCAKGTLLYVSDSIMPVLNQSQKDWENKSIYELIHADDEKKVRDQLCIEAPDSGRILDLKTGSVRKESQPEASRLYTSSRRNFICRMKYGNCQTSPTVGAAPGLDDGYAVIHCTGFLKSWLGGSLSDLAATSESNDPSTYCLVAIGRLQPTCNPEIGSDLGSNDQVTKFMSRVTIDGKFTFLSPSVQDVLGYAPKDILGKSCYDFIHPDDKSNMVESYEQVVRSKGQNLSVQFRLRNKRGQYVLMRTVCYSFQNPYTDEPEYILCDNFLVRPQTMDDYQLPGAPIDSWGPSQPSLPVPERPRSSSPSGRLASGVPSRPSPGNHFGGLSQAGPVYSEVTNVSEFQRMPTNPVPHQSLPMMNFSPGSEDRAARVRISPVESSNWCQSENEFDPRKMIALAMEKGAYGRSGIPRPTMDRSPFVSGSDDSRLPPNAVQFHHSPSSTADMSDLQRVVSGPGPRYLDNNNSQMDMNSLSARSLDMKPSIQHLNAFDPRMARMGPSNPLVPNPALITSAAAQMNPVCYPYSNCDI